MIFIFGSSRIDEQRAANFFSSLSLFDELLNKGKFFEKKKWRTRETGNEFSTSRHVDLLQNAGPPGNAKEKIRARRFQTTWQSKAIKWRPKMNDMVRYEIGY